MTLDNKLGLENIYELAEAEERITKKKALELFESGELDNIEVGTFRGLSVNRFPGLSLTAAMLSRCFLRLRMLFPVEQA